MKSKFLSVFLMFSFALSQTSYAFNIHGRSVPVHAGCGFITTSALVAFIASVYIQTTTKQCMLPQCDVGANLQCCEGAGDKLRNCIAVDQPLTCDNEPRCSASQNHFWYCASAPVNGTYSAADDRHVCEVAGGCASYEVSLAGTILGIFATMGTASGWLVYTDQESSSITPSLPELPAQ